MSHANNSGYHDSWNIYTKNLLCPVFRVKWISVVQKQCRLSYILDRPTKKQCSFKKGIHLYLPQYCERNSCHNVKLFLLSSGFSGPNCDWHLMGKNKNLQYVRVQIFSQIMDILVVHLIQFFYSYFKNINFFKIGPKLTFLQCFFHGTIFLVEEFLLS